MAFFYNFVKKSNNLKSIEIYTINSYIYRSNFHE